MTASDWKKVLKQLRRKPAILAKYTKHNKPKDRKYGISTKKCESCGRFGALVNKYGIHLCRHCFREMAEDLGFNKFS